MLLWSGTAEAMGPDLANYPLESILWDPATPTPTITTQAFDEDLFCSGHAFLADGRLVVAGGATTPGAGIRSTHVFDPRPGVESWSRVADMAQPRWYPTLLTLPDGHILAIGGRGGATQEIFDGTAWSPLAGADRDFPEMYPSNHLLPVGSVFYSRAGWAAASTVNLQTGYLSLGPPAAWTDLGTQAFPDREEGTAVLQIDDTVSPPRAQVLIFGGGYSTQANAQSCEIIDVTSLSPSQSWRRGRDMAFRRVNVNAVLLPDGTILIVGGNQGVGRFGANQPVRDVELYDPRSDKWTTLAPMMFPRCYHSVAVLLPDGRVLSTGGTDGFTNQRNMEVFTPPICLLGRAPTSRQCRLRLGTGAPSRSIRPTLRASTRSFCCARHRRPTIPMAACVAFVWQSPDVLQEGSAPARPAMPTWPRPGITSSSRLALPACRQSVTSFVCMPEGGLRVVGGHATFIKGRKHDGGVAARTVQSASAARVDRRRRPGRGDD